MSKKIGTTQNPRARFQTGPQTFGVVAIYRDDFCNATRRHEMDDRARRVVCSALARRGCPHPDTGTWVAGSQRGQRELEFDDISKYPMTQPQAERVARALKKAGFGAKIVRPA